MPNLPNMPKNAINFVCEKCDFSCSKQSNWLSHTSTSKHTNRTKMNIIEQNKFDQSYTCKYCDKHYKARNSLWYHENKCKNATIEIENQNENQKSESQDLVTYLMKQNQELMQKQNCIIEKPIEIIDSNTIIKQLIQQNKDFKDLLIEQNKTMIEAIQLSLAIKNNSA